MKQTNLKLKVIWEEVTTPDAPERLAAAFAMLLGPLPPREIPPDQNLDSQ